MNVEGTHGEPARFPSTHWTEVQGAGRLDSAAHVAALGNLLMRYRPALEAYARLRFFSADRDIDDWFQAFVEGPILRRGLIVRARPAKGCRFRSYLLSAWHTFLLEQRRHEAAGKRRPTGGFVPLADESEVPPVEPPENAATFDAAWAKTVLAEAVTRMRAHCVAEQRDDLWGIFEDRIYRPILSGAPPLPYEELVLRYRIHSPAQARNLLTTAKRMLRRCLVEVVGQYAKGGDAVESELRELQAILESSRDELSLEVLGTPSCNSGSGHAPTGPATKSRHTR